MNRSTVIVTPVKNEQDILPKFFEHITSSDGFDQVKLLVIDNESTDNSPDIIKAWSNRYPNNISCHYFSHPNREYALGEKYSSIIKFGFDQAIAELNFAFIGILDSDCFISDSYFVRIWSAFDADPALGVTSGVPILLGSNKLDGERAAAVRGNCRIWRRTCLEESGYIIGPSADTLSLALAELRGWSAYATQAASLKIRQMGGRSKYEYYGYSAYFRGIDPLIATIKVGRLFARGEFGNSYKYAFGYFSNYMKRTARIPHQELREYFSSISYKRGVKFVKSRFR